ncbi:hypothetical protein FQZ97_820110 [compost metagenome]
MTLCSWAISRIFSARKSPPLASSTGAPPLSASYLSATAKCVGLVITTSACGTACIIRRSAISRCSWRIRPLTSGLPSLSLYSSLTSCLVIISFCLLSQSWNGTSTAAIRMIPQEIHSALQPTTWTLCRIATSSGWWAIASSSSRSEESTARATSRTTENLARALSSSTSAFTENIRLSPANGFMRLNLGASASAENSQPPRAMGPTMAAISRVTNSGTRASRAIFPEASRNSAMLCSLNSTSRGRLKLVRMICSSASARLPPEASRPPQPAIRMARVLSSRERAIWPFSRDSRRRFSVGCSLLSAPFSFSAT